MVSFLKDHRGGQTPGVQEGKQGSESGSNAGDQVNRGGDLVWRGHWGGSCFNSLFCSLVLPPLTSSLASVDSDSTGQENTFFSRKRITLESGGQGEILDPLLNRITLGKLFDLSHSGLWVKQIILKRGCP